MQELEEIRGRAKKWFVTQIQLSKETVKRLKKAKTFKMETYDEEINRLLNQFSKESSENRRLAYELKKCESKLAQIEKFARKELGLTPNYVFKYEVY